MKLSSESIRKTYSYYLKFGFLPSKTPKSYFDNYVTSWNQEEIDYLKQIVDDNPVLYIDEMATELKEHFHNKSFSKTSISKVLRKTLKYSRKVVYEKASQAISRQKNEFIEALKHYLKTPEMALFIDESNKDRIAARRKYGWSKIGVPVSFRAQFNRDARYTFIGAADCFGFVIPACDYVLHYTKEKEEQLPVDADRFVEYFKNKVVPILGNYFRREPHSVVIMDNCSIHIDHRILQMVQDAGAIIIFSAPYSPELIPIEYMFHQWKSFLKRHHQEFARDWFTVHHAAIASVTPEQGLNYFRNTTLIELVENHIMYPHIQEEIATLLLLNEIVHDMDN